MSEGIITIRKGREKPIRNQHPWIFSGAIAEAKDASPGEIVTVVDHKGDFLARGYWNKRSQIQVRILTWQDEQIDDAWWYNMLKRSVDKRYPNPMYGVGHRIINAENDFIPGLIVDRYADYLVIQALTLYIDKHKKRIATMLTDIFGKAKMPLKGIYERSDVDVRKKEGLDLTTGVLWGEEPPELVTFTADERQYLVDIHNGHKTGYYLDQVENQSIFAELTKNRLPEDATILNMFSYTGGFGSAALGHITNVDASEEALELAEKTYEANKRPSEMAEFIQADAFEYLHHCVDEEKQFDIVILDPPKFAHNKQQVDRASRGYKDLNLNAFKLVKSGGYLMTFSCSGAISPDLFQKIVFGALADSGRQAQIIKHLNAGEDHPIALTFPEGEYLKGLLLRVY